MGEFSIFSTLFKKKKPEEKKAPIVKLPGKIWANNPAWSFWQTITQKEPKKSPEKKVEKKIEKKEKSTMKKYLSSESLADRIEHFDKMPDKKTVKFTDKIEKSVMKIASKVSEKLSEKPSVENEREVKKSKIVEKSENFEIVKKTKKWTESK